MSRVVELLRSRRVPQIAVLALMSVGFAGCSADMQTRLSQNTLANPFNYQPEATGFGADGAGRTSRAAANIRGRKPNPRRRNTSHPPCRRPPWCRSRIPIQPQTVACREEGARCRPTPRRAVRNLRPPAPLRRARVAAAHSPAQGTTIIVGTSDTLDILAKRYNISSAAILQANGYKGPRTLSPVSS